jgi:hypothetical protein
MVWGLFVFEKQEDDNQAFHGYYDAIFDWFCIGDLESIVPSEIWVLADHFSAFDRIWFNRRLSEPSQRKDRFGKSVSHRLAIGLFDTIGFVHSASPGKYT